MKTTFVFNFSVDKDAEPDTSGFDPFFRDMCSLLVSKAGQLRYRKLLDNLTSAKSREDKDDALFEIVKYRALSGIKHGYRYETWSSFLSLACIYASQRGDFEFFRCLGRKLKGINTPSELPVVAAKEFRRIVEKVAEIEQFVSRGWTNPGWEGPSLSELTDDALMKALRQIFPGTIDDKEAFKKWRQRLGLTRPGNGHITVGDVKGFHRKNGKWVLAVSGGHQKR